MPRKQIYLTGFMGTGKSTILNYIHKKCGFVKIEMDEQIVREQGMSISDIFEKKGEDYFRNLETNLVKRISRMDEIVVSCGGGTVMRQCNVEEMKKEGTIILLTATPLTVYERVKNSHNRPLLEQNMNPEYIGKSGLVYFLYSLSGRSIPGTSGSFAELSDHDYRTDSYGDHQLFSAG